jgi:hypothetical protein
VPLDKYLRDAAIRFVRTKWTVPWMLGEELYTVLRGIALGPVTLNFGTGDPFDYPEFPEWRPPDWDPDWPEDPVVETEEIDEGYEKTETLYWHRAIYPGQIVERTQGANYNIRLWPNGFLTGTGDGSIWTSNIVLPGEPRAPINEIRECLLTDESLAGTISANIWVYVFRVIRYRVTKETWTGENPRTQTQIDILEEQYLFNAPAEGGAKVARVIQTITARKGTTPGQGRAVLYKYQGPVPDLATGETSSPSLVPLTDSENEETEVDVFNMVSSEITADSDDLFIQVKRIDGAWFIDVEDCSVPSSDEAEIP